MHGSVKIIGVIRGLSSSGGSGGEVQLEQSLIFSQDRSKSFKIDTPPFLANFTFYFYRE